MINKSIRFKINNFQINKSKNILITYELIKLIFTIIIYLNGRSYMCEKEGIFLNLETGRLVKRTYLHMPGKCRGAVGSWGWGVITTKIKL